MTRKTIKLIVRLIASPFVFGTIFIAYNYHAINNTLLFIKHGGEWITYAKADKQTIHEIFLHIKECHDSKK